MEVVDAQPCPNCRKATARGAVFCHLCGCRQALESNHPVAVVAFTFSKVIVSIFLALIAVGSALLGTCFVAISSSNGAGGLFLLSLFFYGVSIGLLALISRVMRA